MLQVCFDCYGTYTTDSVYQWDLNRRLAIRGLDYNSAPTIHFSNKKSTEALVVQSTIEDGVIYCDVPNILLQEPYDIVGYVCESLDQEITTYETIRIPVKPRVKPADYMYSDNVEILTYYALMSEITSVKASTEKKVKNLEVNTEKKINDLDASKASKLELNAVKVEVESDLDSAISNVENEITNVENEIGVERSRIDQIVKLPAGTTTADAELMDIRVDANGKIHESAGSAVRDQVNKLSSEIVDNINTLESVENTIYTRDYISKNPLNWEFGSLNAEGEVDSTIRLRSIDFIPIPVCPSFSLLVGANYEIGIFEYDDNKNYVKNYAYYTSNSLFAFDSKTVYIKFLLKPTFSGSLTISDISKLSASLKPRYYLNNIDSIKSLAESAKYEKDNLIPVNEWDWGSLDNAGLDVAGYTRVRTDFIKVDRRVFDLEYRNTKMILMIFQYDEDKNFLVKSDWLTSSQKIVLNANCKYVRFIAKHNAGDLAYYEQYVYISATFKPIKEVNNVKNTINVMSFNIGLFYDGVSLIPADKIVEQTTYLRKLLAKNNADIIGLQESNVFCDVDKSIESYDQLFINRYKRDGFVLMSGDYNYRTGLSVASEFDLSNYSNTYFRTEYETDERSFIKCYANINGREVAIYNVHFNPTDVQKQSGEREVLLADLANEDTFILFGDFNSYLVEDWRTDYIDFVNAGYKLCNGGWFGDFETYKVVDKSTQETIIRYLDNIIVSPNININNVWLGEEDLIDHRPLCANITIN